MSKHKKMAFMSSAFIVFLLSLGIVIFYVVTKSAKNFANHTSKIAVLLPEAIDPLTLNHFEYGMLQGSMDYNCELIQLSVEDYSKQELIKTIEQSKVEGVISLLSSKQTEEIYQSLSKSIIKSTPNKEQVQTYVNEAITLLKKIIEQNHVYVLSSDQLTYSEEIFYQQLANLPQVTHISEMNQIVGDDASYLIVCHLSDIAPIIDQKKAQKIDVNLIGYGLNEHLVTEVQNEELYALLTNNQFSEGYQLIRAMNGQLRNEVVEWVDFKSYAITVSSLNQLEIQHLVLPTD
ncbi:hypothetical protein [Vagococcus zengguangii]|uniref:hypothetical protein n=1 Tax=Vagococcus zengguangii TaxID=2571750 RepID=UPI0011099732|nr:hypothetical protein [Vagococcus zengguangii]TLG81387.1 hypothetical protein FE258_02595 [Vagococcus zengguangii]